ncbi:MAG: hypothetical protein ACSLFR_14290 [Solirubrobacteraceae bacterium]
MIHPPEHLIALTGDTPVAALAMRGDGHAADPFQRSAGALELLRARRAARVVASISRG